MKKKVICMLLATSLSIMLTACGHEHTWVDATCTEPKTCSECGETEGEILEHTWIDVTCAEPKHCSMCGVIEGEALEHTLTEANYQQPATCEVCGATVGEPEESYFEYYGLVCNAKLDTEYSYKTTCNDDSTKTTIGKLTFSDYEVFTSDETHEALEGYEWRTVTATLTYYDENAQNFGFSTRISYEDYFNNSFDALNYYGKEYTDTAFDYEKEGTGWNLDDRTYTIQYRFYSRVPIGYDGAVICFYSEANDDKGYNIHEKADEDTIFFRLQ